MHDPWENRVERAHPLLNQHLGLSLSTMVQGCCRASDYAHGDDGGGDSRNHLIVY